MNKYQSGYTAMGILAFVGWIVIAISLVGGLLVASNGPPGMGYIGFISAVVGSVQGLLLLGVGSIGAALLDGSVAQQEVAANMAKRDSVAPQREPENLMPYLLSAAVGVPGGKFIDNYKGRLIIRDSIGRILVGGEVFSSITDAKMWIDGQKSDVTSAIDSIKFESDGSMIFNGYRIPKRGNEFLINGVAYANPQEAAKKIMDESDSALSRYRIY